MTELQLVHLFFHRRARSQAAVIVGIPPIAKRTTAASRTPKALRGIGWCGDCSLLPAEAQALDGA